MAGPASNASDPEPWDQRLAAAAAATLSNNKSSMRWPSGQQRAISPGKRHPVTYKKLKFEDELLDDGELPSLATNGSLQPSQQTQLSPRRTPVMISPPSERRKFWNQMTPDEHSYDLHVGPEDEMRAIREKKQYRYIESKLTDEEMELESNEGGTTFCGQTFSALEELCGGNLGVVGSEEDTLSLLKAPQVRYIRSMDSTDQQEQTAIEVEYLEPMKRDPVQKRKSPEPKKKETISKKMIAESKTNETEQNIGHVDPRRVSPAQDEDGMSEEEGDIHQRGMLPVSPEESGTKSPKVGMLAAQARKAKQVIQQSRRLINRQNSAESENSSPDEMEPAVVEVEPSSPLVETSNFEAPSMEDMAIEIEMNEQRAMYLKKERNQSPYTPRATSVPKQRKPYPSNPRSPSNPRESNSHQEPPPSPQRQDRVTHDLSVPKEQEQAPQFPVTHRKNATLAAIAKKARENFKAKRSKTPKPVEGQKTAKPIEQSQKTAESIATLERKSTNDIYTSFSATEKRMFLKLINGGLPAVEAMQQVTSDRERASTRSVSPAIVSPMNKPEDVRKEEEVDEDHREEKNATEPVEESVPTKKQVAPASTVVDNVDTFPFSKSGQLYYDAVRRDIEEEKYAENEAALRTTVAGKSSETAKHPQKRFFPGGKQRGFSELKDSPSRSIESHAEQKTSLSQEADEHEVEEVSVVSSTQSPKLAAAVAPAVSTMKNIKQDSKVHGKEEKTNNKGAGMRIAKNMMRYQKFDGSARQVEGRGLPFVSEAVAISDDHNVSVLPAPSGEQSEPEEKDESVMDVTMDHYFNSAENLVLTQAPAPAPNDSASVYTMGTNMTETTSYTQSTRIRRPGAAKNRLAIQKQLETENAKKRGWHDTIRAAAESTNRVWDAQQGWVDYEEPEIDRSVDVSGISAGSEKIRIDLSKAVPPGNKKLPTSSKRSSPPAERVPFPEEWHRERTAMINDVAVRTRRDTTPESQPQIPKRSPTEVAVEEEDEGKQSEFRASPVFPPVDVVTEKVDEGDKSLFSADDSRDLSVGSIPAPSVGSDDMEVSIETGPRPLAPPSRPSRRSKKPVPKLRMSKRDTSPLRVKAIPRSRTAPKAGDASASKPEVPVAQEVSSRQGKASRQDRMIETPAGSTSSGSEERQPKVSPSSDKPVNSRRKEWEAIVEKAKSSDSSDKHAKEIPQMPENFTAAGWMTFLGKKVRAESEAAAGSVVLGDSGERTEDRSMTTQDTSVSDQVQDNKPSNSLNISGISPIKPDGEQFSDADETYGSSIYGPSPAELRSASFMKRLTECAAPVMAKHLNGYAPNPICGHPDEQDSSYSESIVSGSLNRRGGAMRTTSSGDFQLRASSVPRLRGAGSSSVASDDFGAKAAYLDAVAIKSAVSRSRSSRRSGRSSQTGGSVVSAASGATDHSEKWKALLEKRRASGISPLSSRLSNASASRAAEQYASSKVGELVELARESTRSKTVARSREIHREVSTGAGQVDHSMKAAEDLAAARVEAMMAALSNDNSRGHEGEI